MRAKRITTEDISDVDKITKQNVIDKLTTNSVVQIKGVKKTPN